MPLDLEKAILRCLRKDPARRYRTMADLKVALDDLADDSAARQSVARSVVAVPWRWAGAALVAVVAAAAYVAWPAAPPSDPVSPELHAVPLNSLPGVTRSPSFSPDGNQVAFTWTRHWAGPMMLVENFR